MSVDIEIIRKPRQLRHFFKLADRLYRDDPNWVAPLLTEQKKLLDPKRNPFFEHAQMTRLLARKNGRVVGRICAIDNRAHVDYWQEPVGFFGFFEAENDPEVAKALLQAAADWLKPRGLTSMRGPFNPSTNDTCGLLVDGFDSPPVIMMTYNPPYYMELLEKCGLTKLKDLYAYKVTKEDVPQRLWKGAESIRERLKISIRPLKIKRLKEDIELVRSIYNSAWSKNWGFIPMTSAEFDHLAQDLKKILDSELAFIAEDGERPVGFSLSLPDLNVALRHINGRLFPFGLFKLLYYARKIKNIRVITMGVIEEYRGRGIDALFYLETIQRGTKRGYDWAETSWILEDNVPMNRAMNIVGGKIYKRYRIYEMPL
jgi:GNAT superfamily N-acetyltransferase